MREHVVVPSIRSREIAQAEWSGVWRCEYMLKPLDFGNSLLGVHSVSISTMAVAIVKRGGKLIDQNDNKHGQKILAFVGNY